MTKRKVENDDSELLNLLECPVCSKGPLLPPLMQCSNGHLVCGDCRAKPSCSTCPTCKVGPFKTRNFYLEKLANRQLCAPCKHAGCGRNVRYGDLASHARDCEFQPFPCSVQHCDVTLPLDPEHVIRHFEDTHHFVESPASPDHNSGAMFFFHVHSGEMPGVEWPGKAFSACGSQFVLRMLEVSVRYHCLVQFLGPSSLASQFVCRLTFEEGPRCLQWTGPPTPISTPHKQLLEHDDCLTIKRSMMKLVKELEGVEQMRIRLEIQRAGDMPVFQGGESAARFHFVNFKSLKGLPLSIVDICGVVVSTLSSEAFIGKDGQGLIMRKILVVDDTAFSLEVIIVGTEASLPEDKFQGNPVIALKDVEVKEQRDGLRGFVSLARASKDLILEPETCTAVRIRQWWKQYGAPAAVIALSTLNMHHCTVAKMRSALSSVGDEVEYFDLIARLSQVSTQQQGKRTSMCYSACAEARENGLPCHARLRDDKCTACRACPRKLSLRLNLRCQFVDTSRRGWLTTGHEAAEQVLAMTASQIKSLETKASGEQVQECLEEQYFARPLHLTVRAELVTSNGEPRINASCVRAYPVNRREHGRALLHQIYSLIPK